MTDLPPPIQHLGRYDIVRVLGQGAMGVVYEGRDPNLDRRVAIKTVRVMGMAPGEIAEYEQRFKTEAKSAGRLQHPNIVSVYDSSTHIDATGKTAYIVMEFVQGEDLKHFLDHGKRFSLEQTAYMMSDLLAALAYAHKNKIVHRDIKPANLLLTKDGRIKLTDFGVARITDSGEATKTSAGTVGTLKYMSPEQVAGKGVDASSDLFSAGIVLYQLLTGSRPFDGEGYLDIVSKIVKEDPIPPSHIVGALPLALDAVVAKALAKSKLDRFPDAASFAAALKSAVNNADLTITPSAHARPEVLEGMSTFPGSLGNSTGGSTVTQELELVYWKDVKDSPEPEVLEGFLKRFPVGIYADLAKRKLKGLADAAQAAGQASRYEATQIRKLGDSTFGAMPAPPVRGAAPDDATLHPSAYNDSEYGPSTQFASTQFPPTAPGHLEASSSEPASFEPAAETPAKVSAPKPQKSTASVSKWVLASVATLGVGAAIFWMTRSAVPTASTAASATATTATAAVTPSPSGSSAEPSNPASSPATATPANTASGQGANTSASGPATAAVAAPSPVASAAARFSSAIKANLPVRKTSAPIAPNKPTASFANPSPSQAATGGAAPAPAPSPEAAPSPAANSRPAPANRGVVGPKEACEGRILLGYLLCVSEQCERPVLRNHPVCVERREMEERRRNAPTNN
jgi:eukaryotic-like serine/threonine-protein kinase